MTKTNSPETQLALVTEVLMVTRDQLSRAINLNAELEAMLNLERKRANDLESRLSELSAEESDKK